MTERDSRGTTARFPAQTTFIDGSFVDGDGAPVTVTYPGDGSVVGETRESTSQQVAEAVAAAEAARAEWAATSSHARADLLERAAAAIVGDQERLAHLVTLDNGKTYGEATLDVFAAASLLRSAAGWATRVKGRTLPADDGLDRYTRLEPVGVVAVFMPFNAPLMFCAMKIGAAVAMGNTVVAKSPAQNPYAAAAFAEHLAAAGLPAGVVNIVQGGPEVGDALVRSPGVSMVSFTGSSAVGAEVGAAAVGSYKRVILELGGKSANIVYADADLDLAVDGSLGAIFRNGGQRCFSGSRLLVQDTVADEFIARFVAGADALRVGDPFDPDTQVGALITAGDAERVFELVARAEQEGAKVLCGGTVPDDGPPEGAYVRPTVIDCTSAPDAEIVGHEVFGPVVTVQRFSTVDEAIALANSTSYALAGGCWSTDIATCLRTAREVDAGMFWVNSYGVHGGTETTIGGRGASGFGQEMGEEGVLAYVNAKTVLVDHGHGDSITRM